MQRGFGIIGLLFGLLILIILITSAMSISVNQLKTQEKGRQPFYKEKTEQVEEMYERNREMQRRQMDGYENGYEEENYERNDSENVERAEKQDIKSRKKHSRLKGKRELQEEFSGETKAQNNVSEQNIEEQNAEEHNLDELRSPEKKEQFLEIIEKDFRETGSMVELD